MTTIPSALFITCFRFTHICLRFTPACVDCQAALRIEAALSQNQHLTEAALLQNFAAKLRRFKAITTILPQVALDSLLANQATRLITGRKKRA